MISLKKSYARQLLQLALTLSLLRVDPESYLGFGWQSQLALQNGDGWQLELRAAPLSDYPYSNRKALIPLIEDLVRFDRQMNVTSHDIQTYLLNVQNEQLTTISSAQASVPPSTNQHETNTTVSNAATLQSQNVTRNATDYIVPMGSDLADLFLHSDLLAETTSVLDQTLADLNEYEGIHTASDDPFLNFNSLYSGLPLKDEPPEMMVDQIFNVGFNEPEQEAGTSNNDAGLNAANRNPYYGLLRSPDSVRTNYSHVIEWSEYFRNDSVKEEEKSKNDYCSSGACGVSIKTEPDESDEEPRPSGRLGSRRLDSGVKFESDLDDDVDARSSFSSSKNSTSGFSSNVELTEEESEIVEVLWKQDVDLGYTLAPAKATSSKDATASSSNTSLNVDETEKLKALQDLKKEILKPEDSPKSDNTDEWAGIQFTVDNETGEYIQLPQLDEILQDVLQLAELSNDDERVDKILSEKLEKSGYGELSTNSNSNSNTNTNTNSNTNSNSNSNFSFIDKTLNEGEVDTDIASGGEPLPSASPLLLDPPLTDEEISADISDLINEANNLEELDMMIQSAGPFQPPRSVGQNYGHGANSYHRQPSYHPQSRMSLSRAVSMEQLRLQGIASSLFNSPLQGMGVGMGVSDMPSYYPPHYSYQGTGPISQHEQFSHPQMSLHNATLAELGSTQSTLPPSPQQPHYAPNLGTAVSSSMHLTNASHETDVGATGYKMDHDMMYYTNTSSELNHTSDGFINAILNDEEFAMQFGADEGFYTMRMMDSNSTSNNSSVLGAAAGAANLSNNGLLQSSMPTHLTGLTGVNGTLGATGDRLDSSSDSAVSSMGSERVPSLSDGEWGDAGSDSAQGYHQSKYGRYDYSYSNRLGDSVRHPVAQKKHQMFGKRFFQDQSNVPNLPQVPGAPGVQQPDAPIKYEYEPYAMHHHGQPMAHNLEEAIGGINKHQAQHHPLSQQSEIKYSCSLDFARQNRGMHDVVSHNHTYTLPQGTGATPRPQARDKKPMKKSDEEHLTRDEKRARALNIPMPVSDIINLPMDEFNERLSKFELSEAQLSLIRDIRRRGKNKVAAQNCRKRKMDQINDLAREVQDVRTRKEILEAEGSSAISDHASVKAKFNALYKHIFENLRDEHGNAYSQEEYNLQQSADGRVHLLPRDRSSNNNIMDPRNGTQHNQHLQQQRPHQPSSNHPHSHHHHHNGHHPHHHQH